MTIQTVICLAIDMIGSTDKGLKMSEPAFRAFNKGFISRIHPYIRKFELEDALLKFTGDGWLLQTPDIKKMRAVVAFAKTLTEHFRVDLAKTLSKEINTIPSLRLAVYSGEDEWLETSPALLDEKEQQRRAAVYDWVGDSARRAVRASQACEPNLLVIGSTIKEKILREFDVKKLDIDKSKIGKWEEDLEVFAVHDLHTSMIDDLSTDPASYAPYVTYLAYRDKPAAAKELYGQISKAFIADEKRKRTETPALFGRDAAEQERFGRMLFYAPSKNESLALLKEAKQELGASPDVYTFNKLIHKASSYKSAVEWFGKMQAADVRPDQVTYSTMISKADSFANAVEWFGKMQAADVCPDQVTYSTMISKADSFANAVEWFGKMQAADVRPNEVTYSTMISKADSFANAVEWFGKMQAADVRPNEVTFNTMISKADSFANAVEWFGKMQAAGVRPDQVTYSTMISKADSFANAVEWFGKMQAADVRPDEVTAVSLTKWITNPDEATQLTQRLQKDGCFLGEGFFGGVCSQLAQTGNYCAQDILSWWGKQRFKHAKSLAGAIRAFAAQGRLEDALRIALAFPFLDAARKVFRTSPEESKRYFRQKLEEPFEPQNAIYALAYCYLESGDLVQANKMFLNAKEDTTEKRKVDIEARLSEISRREKEAES